MTTHSLRQIRASCTELVDMALDVNMHDTNVSYDLIRPATDVKNRQASEFLNIIARFPNLRKLELTAGTDLAKYPNVRDKVDPDFDSTKVIFKQLHSGKIGLFMRLPFASSIALDCMEIVEITMTPTILTVQESSNIESTPVVSMSNGEALDSQNRQVWAVIWSRDFCS
jgi:hypothetical protein